MTYALNYIPVDLIEDNKANFYSMGYIDALADNIRTVGLLHPIRVVRVKGGRYRCIDGHRRLSAFRRIAEDDEGFQRIPAYEVPLMDDLEEQTVLLLANANNRQMTTAELHRQESELRQIMAARKEAGKPVPKNLSVYMASALGVSRNEVSRMHTTNTQLIPEGKKLLEEGKLNASTAYEIARKPEAEQRAALSAPPSPAAPSAPAHAARSAGKAEPSAPAQTGIEFDAKAYRLQEEQRQEALVRLCGKFLYKYAPERIWKPLHEARIRNDVVAAVKDLLCRTHTGMAGPGYDYSFNGAKITAGESAGARDVTCTPAEFADAMLLSVLRCFVGGKLRADTPQESGVSNLDIWHTGLPSRPGTYICRVHHDRLEKPVYVPHRFDGKKWDTFIPIQCWIPAPEAE